MRGIFSFEATERSGQEIAERSLRENLDFIDAHQNDPLVSGAMSWHTVFTCSPLFIERAADEARVRSTWYHAHCNEGTHEGNWKQENHGMDTMAFYRELGVADQSFLASQCVQMTVSELDIIAATGTRVSHMPLSNCEVGGGIAPIAELLAKGSPSASEPMVTSTTCTRSSRHSGCKKLDSLIPRRFPPMMSSLWQPRWCPGARDQGPRSNQTRVDR